MKMNLCVMLLLVLAMSLWSIMQQRQYFKDLDLLVSEYVILMITDGCPVYEHQTRSLPLLLPAVEDGIFNDNWRIRQSSVELLGDLLFKVVLCFFCFCFFLNSQETFMINLLKLE